MSSLSLWVRTACPAGNGHRRSLTHKHHMYTHACSSSTCPRTHPQQQRQGTTMDFKTQMATLRERSDKAMELGPPAWLTRPPCLEGPLSEAEVGGWVEGGWLGWGVLGAPRRHHSTPAVSIDRSIDRARVSFGRRLIRAPHMYAPHPHLNPAAEAVLRGGLPGQARRLQPRGAPARGPRHRGTGARCHITYCLT